LDNPIENYVPVAGIRSFELEIQPLLRV